MIIAKEFPNKEFATKEELFKYLIANERTVVAQKKAINKEADATVYLTEIERGKSEATKSDSNDMSDVAKLKAKLVINTTGLYDSHGDVHIKGIWKKSVSEVKNLLLLQEHKMTFDHIISDNVTPSVKTMSWKSLGFDYEGSTQALVFDAEIDKERNEYMYKQYEKGYVKEHSVGMRYVKIEMAINSEESWASQYKEVWDKYYDEIVNKADVDANGYFWAVTEAKIVEGSAVVKGSNFATPTISVEAVKDTPTEQPTEPTVVTQTKRKRVII